MKALLRGLTLAGIIAIASSILVATPAQASTAQVTSFPRISVVHNDGVRVNWSDSLDNFTGLVEIRWPNGGKAVRIKDAMSTKIYGIPNVNGVQLQFTDTQHNYQPSGWSKGLNYLLPAQPKAPKLTVKDRISSRSFGISITPAAASGAAKVQSYQLDFQHRSRKSSLKKVTGYKSWSSYFVTKGEDPFADSYVGVKAKSTRMSANFWSMPNLGSASQITRYQYRVRIRACSAEAQNGYYALCGPWSTWSNTVLVAHGKLR